MEKLNSPRELRGLAIMSQGDTIIKVHRGVYTVKSQTGVGEYKVTTGRGHSECTCPDFEKRQTDCKHIFAVDFSRKLKTDIKKDYKADLPQEIEFKPANCPKCKSENIVKHGIRKTQRGEVQRYTCKDCNFRFIVDKGFSHMKHEPKAITLAMDLYFKGVSYRKICDHLKQFYNLKVSPTTPMRWIKKYLKLLGNYVGEYKADVGNIWHSDEMTVFKKKDGEKRHYEWIWNVMDGDTRFLLACRITKERYIGDARKSLKDAKGMTKTRPDAIITDGLRAYETAIPAEFYSRSERINNPHLRLKDFETKPNNNIVERLNGTFRERMKVMRALSTDNGADAYIKGMQTYYNYIRPHQGIGGHTPSQMAHIPINLDGNRWLKMIELATTQKNI